MAPIMQRDASLTIETERAAAGGNGRGVLARWRARAGRLAPCPLDHDVSTHLRLIDGEFDLTSLSLSLPSTQLLRHSGYSLCHSCAPLFVDGGSSIEEME